MLKIYVAGAISDTNPIKVLQNIGIGIQAGADLLAAGYSPFVPHLDILMHFAMANKPLTDVTLWYDYSLEWLRAADGVLVLPFYEHSLGVKMELEEANKLSIPIFYSINEIQNARFGNKG